VADVVSGGSGGLRGRGRNGGGWRGRGGLMRRANVTEEDPWQVVADRRQWCNRREGTAGRNTMHSGSSGASVGWCGRPSHPRGMHHFSPVLHTGPGQRYREPADESRPISQGRNSERNEKR
jgi:hypothetical protein